VCANCGSTVGPFYRAWFEKGIKVTDTPPLCKNTKASPNRITECVERRNKIDADKYKEQLHAYA
jgi:hypothetical protein